MAHLADAQQAALVGFRATPPDSAAIAAAREFRMPVVHATSWRRDSDWRAVLAHLCDAMTALADTPINVLELCERLRRCAPEQIETQADALLAARGAGIDIAAAPFVMGALQVYWVDLASRLVT